MKLTATKREQHFPAAERAAYKGVLAQTKRCYYKVVVLAAALAVSLLSGAVPTTRNAVTQADQTRDLGYYYVAAGEPRTFQDPGKGKIEMISSAGNEYTVSGSKITLICKKAGTVQYNRKGTKKSFRIIIGGNQSIGKKGEAPVEDTKINFREYDLPAFTYNKNSYTNFVDFVRQNTSGNYWVCKFSGKKAMRGAAKYNRGITFHSSRRELQRKYPSLENLGVYGQKTCFYAARYYDEKSGFVLLKAFLVNRKLHVKTILYIGYDPRDPDAVVRL